MSIAFVTGGSRGLGRSMVLNLAKLGHDIAFTYRKEEAEAKAVAAEIRALGRKVIALRLDLNDKNSVAGFAETFLSALRSGFGKDRFDIMIHNAGHGHHALHSAMAEDAFDSLYQVHVRSVFFLNQKLIPYLNDGGKILHISTGLTRFAIPGYAAYAAMKGAVEVLTRYLAKELGQRRITVNTLAPGAIETDFGGGAVRDNADLNRYIAAQTALGRAGRPEDIGRLVAQLVSSDAEWMNAQRIEASGGMFI